MGRRSLWNFPPQQRGDEIPPSMALCFLAHVRGEVPGFEIRETNDEQPGRPIRPVTQGTGKESCLLAQRTENSGPTPLYRLRYIHAVTISVRSLNGRGIEHFNRPATAPQRRPGQVRTVQLETDTTQ